MRRLFEKSARVLSIDRNHFSGLRRVGLRFDGNGFVPVRAAALDVDVLALNTRTPAWMRLSLMFSLSMSGVVLPNNDADLNCGVWAKVIKRKPDAFIF